MNYQKILVTSDFSDDSYRAFDTAAYLSKMNKADVTLLHIVEKPVMYSTGFAYGTHLDNFEEYNKATEKAVYNKLQEIVESHFHGEPVRKKVISTYNSIANEVIEYAKKENIELIVISSHGRGKIGKLLMGSVTERILRHAHCPVLMIPSSREVGQKE